MFVFCLKFILPLKSTKLCSQPDVQKDHNILSRCQSRSQKQFSVSVVCHSLDLSCQQHCLCLKSVGIHKNAVWSRVLVDMGCNILSFARCVTS
jgi:hypothetical protein